MSDLVCDLCKGLDKYMYIGKITKPAYCQNSPTENGCKLKHQGIRNCPIYTKKNQKKPKTNQPTKKKQQKKPIQKYEQNLIKSHHISTHTNLPLNTLVIMYNRFLLHKIIIHWTWIKRWGFNYITTMQKKEMISFQPFFFLFCTKQDHAHEYHIFHIKSQHFTIKVQDKHHLILKLKYYNPTSATKSSTLL